MRNGVSIAELIQPSVLSGEQVEHWRNLVRRHASEIPYPSRVEVILADQYEQVAGDYAFRAVDKMNEEISAEQYQAVKVDGSVAAARTIELAEQRVVVVVAAAMLSLPAAFLQHTVVHEFQHVAMIQHGDQAFAVHRRLAFELPDNQITWELMWLAESAVDEFRAELGVHERRLVARQNRGTVADVAAVHRTFEAARLSYKTSGDLMSTYHSVALSLGRLAQHLAYGAAAIASGTVTHDRWSHVPDMNLLLGLLQELPSAKETLPRQQVADAAVQAAKILRQALQRLGFDLFYTAGGATYLQVD